MEITCGDCTVEVTSANVLYIHKGGRSIVRVCGLDKGKSSKGLYRVTANLVSADITVLDDDSILVSAYEQ